MIRTFTQLALILTFFSCTTTPPPLNTETVGSPQSSGNDEDLWLEEIESAKSLEWVRTQNQVTLDRVEKDPRFKVALNETETLMMAKDKLASGSIKSYGVNNFWRDDRNTKGLLRTMKFADYVKDTNTDRDKKSEKWQTLLDMDALAKQENTPWVYKGMDCLLPAETQCMVYLSNGGKDATVSREFNISSKSFSTKGFSIPEAKTSSAWLDKDTLLVGSNFGPNSMTAAGLPRTLKLWHRGEDMSRAKTVFEGALDDLSVDPITFYDEGHLITLISRSIDFYSHAYYLYKDNKTIQLPLPLDISLQEVAAGQLIIELLKPWKNIEEGSLIAINLKSLVDSAESKKEVKPEVLYSPGNKGSLNQVSATKSHLIITYLENVKGRALALKFSSQSPAKWKKMALTLPDKGSVYLTSSNRMMDDFFIQYEDFLTPTSLYHFRNPSAAGKVIRQEPARFDSRQYDVDALQAKSKDGTQVPYFVIHRKNLTSNGQNPTLLYGYGGFQVQMLPRYSPNTGRLWLEKGGVYVLANIRGGGEFGPKWHQAALQKNRQRAFDDFIAVAEDLNQRKITSPQKLAIMGGSNGGLLVGTAFTQRPDLYKAVVCQVPLLDMLRYHKLLTGPAWIAEYGNPDDAEMRPIIEKYSPYQNLAADKSYPSILFATSTKDDRVHPGHARRMAAKMARLNKPFSYYERIEGGHGGASDLKNMAHSRALEWTWLYQELGM